MPICQACGADHPAGNSCRDEEEAFSTNPVYPGAVLGGQWEIESRLGRGGMSTVFLASDHRLGRKVAVKVLSEELAQDREWLSRFDRETRLTANLDHPNIVPIYGQGQHGSRPFVVMKRLEGMPLSRYLKTVPLPMGLPEVRALMSQLCAALEHLHQKGLVHRDIKPGNLFIGPDGHLTLLDLGIALDSAADPLTRTGVVMGTPQYIAPEQALAGRVDARSDIFSATVLLAELLTGTRPQGRIAPLPPPLTEVIRRGMARDPTDRYQTARELFDSLDSAIERVLRPPRKKSNARTIGLLIGAGALAAVGLAVALAVGLRPSEFTVAEVKPPPGAIERESPPVPAIAAPTLHVEEGPSTPPLEELPAPSAVVEPASAPKADVPHRAKKPSQRTAVVKEVKLQPPTVADAPAQLTVVAKLDGQPAWANVVVDGKPVGACPLLLRLPAGPHLLRIEPAGSPAQERRITVEPGQSLIERFELPQ